MDPEKKLFSRVIFWNETERMPVTLTIHDCPNCDLNVGLEVITTFIWNDEKIVWRFKYYNKHFEKSWS